MDSPLDNFTGSLANALRPAVDNKYRDYSDLVVIQHRRYTEKREYIDYMFSKPQGPEDVAKLTKYRELTEEKRWHEFAIQLTTTIQYQVEFIKNLPLFGNMCQEDQITSIKSCMLEMAIIRLSRLINLEKDMVLYVDVMMPIEHCAHLSDPRDVALVEEIFETAKAIARLNLTDTELAVFSTLILSLPDYHNTLVDSHFMVGTYDYSIGALKQETEINHPTPDGGVPVLDQLVAMTPTFRKLSVMHIEALRRFEAAYDLTNFPESLYKEMFCTLPSHYCCH